MRAIIVNFPKSIPIHLSNCYILFFRQKISLPSWKNYTTPILNMNYMIPYQYLSYRNFAAILPKLKFQMRNNSNIRSVDHTVAIPVVKNNIIKSERDKTMRIYFEFQLTLLTCCCFRLSFWCWHLFLILPEE